MLLLCDGFFSFAVVRQMYESIGIFYSIFFFLDKYETLLLQSLPTEPELEQQTDRSSHNRTAHP